MRIIYSYLWLWDTYFSLHMWAQSIIFLAVISESFAWFKPFQKLHAGWYCRSIFTLKLCQANTGCLWQPTDSACNYKSFVYPGYSFPSSDCTFLPEVRRECGDQEGREGMIKPSMQEMVCIFLGIESCLSSLKIISLMLVEKWKEGEKQTLKKRFKHPLTFFERKAS